MKSLQRLIQTTLTATLISLSCPNAYSDQVSFKERVVAPDLNTIPYQTLSVLPLSQITDSNAPESSNAIPKINVNFYIANTNDIFFESCKTNMGDSLPVKVAKKVAKFYDKYGFNLKFDFQEGELINTTNKPVGNNSIKLFYTSTNQLADFFNENPKIYFADREGEIWVNEYEDMNKKYDVIFSNVLDGYSIARAHKEKLRKGYEELWKDDFYKTEIEGMSSKFSKSAYVMPLHKRISDVLLSDEEYANAQALIVSHQIAHVLGLNDRFYQSSVPNLMSLESNLGKKMDGRESFRRFIDFNTALSVEQVKEIKTKLQLGDGLIIK